MTRTIDVVSDANVALKWFHASGEEDVEAAHALLAAHRSRAIAIVILDLTLYEVGNVLLRGRARADAEQTAVVLEALTEICPVVSPNSAARRLSATLAERHDLTLYDATYAAVAQVRDATLVTFDRALLRAGLRVRPGEIIA